MKISRDVTKYINYVLDNILSPILRDRRWLMSILFKLALKKKAKYFLEFKERSFSLTQAEFLEYYKQTEGLLGRETDLNAACVEALLVEDIGATVLEAGCGSGYLSGLLSKKCNSYTAVDINISSKTKEKYQNINFQEASLESLPFPDKSFDTVICTHTLEHVLDLHKSISELRRVAGKKLIIIVPCQRPYKYTFDLHLHFFPYEFSILHSFKPSSDCEFNLRKIDNDWYYVEKY